jgi:undecaprenyl-diphosphatase
MDLGHGILLAVVEGLTEFLPISSTGHIILTSYVMGISGESFVKDYTVIVQSGAIASVLVLYWRRFFRSIEFYKKLFIGFLPAGVLGLLVKNHIDRILDRTDVVAWSLLLGGVFLLLIDKRNGATSLPAPKSEENVTYKQALLIGLAQCVAFIPGVSRAAATIIGGLWQGLDRKRAAEFSFILAVPTLTGATFIKLLKIAPTITSDQVTLIILGNMVSFGVGLLAIRFFIYYLGRFGFSQFAWYRILLGSLFLGMSYFGIVMAH